MSLSGFNTILHAIPDSMALVETSGKIVSVNRSWQRFASQNGADEPTIQGVGQNYIDVCRSAVGAGVAVGETVLRAIDDVRAERKEMCEIEYECHSPTEQRWFIARITLVAGEPDAVVLISHVDITQRKLAELRTQQESKDNLEASLTDSLTKLRNRRGLDLAGRVMWEGVNRHEDKLAAIFMDVNDFKPVNDKFGHSEGDRVLKTVAQHLRETFRDSDLIARVGGDEFVVLARVKRTTDEVLLTSRLKREFEFTAPSGETYRVSTSLGVAVQGDESFESLDELIQTADERMYTDKKNKKGAG